MRFILAIILPTIAVPAFSQRTNQFMIAVHADLIKSDNDRLFEKMQGGFEGSYYTSRKFAATAAAEWWSSSDDPIIIAGARFCPIDEAFIRVRWLIKEDFSFGAGFAKPLSDTVRLEAMADYYWDGQIAIRAGVAVGLGRKP